MTNRINDMNKPLLVGCICAALLFGCTSSPGPIAESNSSFRLFINGYWLFYPDFFSEIDAMDAGRFIRFTSNSQRAYMQVIVTSKEQAAKDRAQFLERGWHIGEAKMLASGAQADLLFSDLRRTPEEGANCSFAYQYSVPTGENDVVSLWYQVSDENWHGEDSHPCTVYKDPEYSFHLKQLESIIGQFQP